MPRHTDSLLDLNRSYTITDNTQERAAQLGCIMVVPAYNQLQIDIDTPEQFIEYATRLKTLRENRPDLIFTEDVRSSRSGGSRYHSTLTFSNMLFDQTSRIAWQMMLASDPVREALSMFGVIMGHENPSVFFERGTQPCVYQTTPLPEVPF